MTIRSIGFESDAHYEAMRQLAIAIIESAGLPAYATIGDMDWWRYADDDPSADIRGVRLWLDNDGRALAFAWPSAGQVDILVHPHEPQLQDVVLAWAEANYELIRPEDSTAPLRVWSFTTDTARTRALKARGLRRTDSYLVYYLRDLLSPPPVPLLPEGYAIARLETEADIAARAAVQRAAFESEFMTIDKQHAVMSAPTYRRDLDVVVRAPDGSFAAFALVWLDEVNHLGVFEPVGVSALHQRRGLGRVVMLEGLRRLQTMGAHRAVVQTGPLNEAARALYESVGFMEVDRCYAWVSSQSSPDTSRPSL